MNSAPCAQRTILTINGGSSSIKFALFALPEKAGERPVRTLSGAVERIGLPGTVLKATGADGHASQLPITAASHREASEFLIDWLRKNATGGATQLAAVGHRVVHGGLRLVTHQRITDELIAELKRTQPLDLAHLPREISLIETFRGRFPNLPQIACFDTAFHRELPRVAQLLPIPRNYIDAGIRRFGFHGISYAYLMDELRRTAGDVVANGRIVLAHLGSGASMAAVHGGKPIDTTMAFTPTAGLVMGTRPGDLDPGLLVYLMRVEKLSPEQMDEFVSQRCGLLGVSDTTYDMRDLIARRATDPRAADAVALFCYQARKFIGSFAAAMGGLDTLVFSGGIGEHSTEVRAEICQGLEFLGLKVDAALNAANAPIISATDSRVTARIIPTDEEIMIAIDTARLLKEPAA